MKQGQDYALKRIKNDKKEMAIREYKHHQTLIDSTNIVKAYGYVETSLDACIFMEVKTCFV